MSQSVGTLRNVSSAIGSELDEQAVMLDEFGAEIEQAETKLDATMRKMVRLLISPGHHLTFHDSTPPSSVWKNEKLFSQRKNILRNFNSLSRTCILFIKN